MVSSICPEFHYYLLDSFSFQTSFVFLSCFGSPWMVFGQILPRFFLLLSFYKLLPVAVLSCFFPWSLKHFIYLPFIDIILLIPHLLIIISITNVWPEFFYYPYFKRLFSFFFSGLFNILFNILLKFNTFHCNFVC